MNTLLLVPSVITLSINTWIVITINGRIKGDLVKKGVEIEQASSELDSTHVSSEFATEFELVAGMIDRLQNKGPLDKMRFKDLSCLCMAKLVRLQILLYSNPGQWPEMPAALSDAVKDQLSVEAIQKNLQLVFKRSGTHYPCPS